MRWEAPLIVLVGLSATAALYVTAVSQVQPAAQSGSGTSFVPVITEREQYFLTYTGSGTLRSEVKDERTYLELLFDHGEKGLSVSQYMAKTAQDDEVRLVADSISRRYRFDLLQIRSWLLEWYSIEKPLPGATSLPLALDTMEAAQAQKAYIDYMLRQHSWASAMTRVALERILRSELEGFSRQRLRVNAQDIDVLTQLQKRF